MRKRPRLIIIGGGEHACVVAEAARTQTASWNLVGFADPRQFPETPVWSGLRQFAGDEEGLAQAAAAWFVMGIGQIGSAPRRRKLAARYTEAGGRWATIVHANAWVSPTAKLSSGVVVLAGAIVNGGAVIGEHAVVNSGAIVEHDVTLGAFSMVGPGAIVGGGAAIGQDVYLGLGCRVRDHIVIGDSVTVGMGAVVVKPLAKSVVAFGVPARPRR